VLGKDAERPAGYVYPPAGIEMGRTAEPSDSAVKPLSPKSLEKFREAVRGSAATARQTTKK
jgi:hypothetical protein